jgi:class 3 adenylate cyclase/CheY-like chemotaxis protein
MTTPGVAQRALRHELRTPLNQILGYAELLEEELREAKLASSADDALRIVSAARRLASLIDVAVPEMAAISEPTRIPAAAPALGSLQHSDHAGCSLLVVDDDDPGRELLVRRLAARGFVVASAPGGAEALELVAHHAFHLVLLDVEMPGLSGFDVLRQLRTRYSRSDLPVVMATGRDGSADVVEALSLGANDYVTKPLDLAIVLGRVESLLAVKRARDEAVRLAADLEIANRFIRQTFGRFVSPEVADQVLSSPEGLEMGGERRRVTVLTSDIRGFSSITETLDPASIVTMLNVYLGAMTDVILAYGGTIDEFIGDGILAIFGAPLASTDHARQALECAVAMQAAIPAVNARLAHLGLETLEMGVAVNTGEGTVGNIGSEQRTKYGVVGPIINVCSRIEAVTLGGQILTTAATLQDAGGDVEIGEARSLTMKGASAPLTVFEVRGIAGAHVVAGTEALRRLARPIGIAVMAVSEAKLIGAERFGGRVLAISRVGASIEVARIGLAVFDGVRVRFAETNANAYARVIAVAGDVYEIRFSWLGPGTAELIDAVAS